MRGGVYLFNMKTSKFEAQPYINSQLYRDGQIKALEIDHRNNLWIGTNEGVALALSITKISGDTQFWIA